MTMDDAARLAEERLAEALPRRWRHVRSVARRARWVAKELALPDDLVIALRPTALQVGVCFVCPPVLLRDLHSPVVLARKWHGFSCDWLSIDCQGAVDCQLGNECRTGLTSAGAGRRRMGLPVSIRETHSAT